MEQEKLKQLFDVVKENDIQTVQSLLKENIPSPQSDTQQVLLRSFLYTTYININIDRIVVIFIFSSHKFTTQH